MIADLPPDHPVEALVSAVHAQVRTLPDIAPALLPHVRVRVSAELYSDPARSGAEDVWGSANDDGIVLYPGTRKSRPLAVASRLGQVVLGQHRLATLDHLWVDERGRVIERTRGARYLTAAQGEMLALVLHETLHRTVSQGPSKWHTMTPAQRSIEEGVVDAVAHDLSPWLAARMFRAQFEETPRRSYLQCRGTVRKASAAATSGKWTSHAARRWRRGFLTLSPTQRETTLVRLGRIPGCDMSQ